jgi:pimeloyl-ACP methyl ester carboxylesterase
LTDIQEPNYLAVQFLIAIQGAWSRKVNDVENHEDTATSMTDGTRERTDTRFVSGTDTCHAWLYLPHAASKSRRAPVVVMAHGLGGVKRLRLDAFAERFRDAGYACLVFDYRHFGDSGGEPRELLDIALQRADWRAAVAYARTVEEIDPERVIVWGTSFAGGHVIVTAADDPRIAAAIAQCPFTDGPASVLAINPKSSVKLAARALQDVASKLLGLAPVRVPLTGKPGEVGMMTAPDAVTGYQAMVDDAGMTGMPDRVPARIAFQIMRDAPGRRAKDVTQPILFCVCRRDSVAPSRPTLKHARRAPKGEIKLNDYGHFYIYLGAPFEQVIGEQIAFLKRHVPTAS